MEHPQGTTILVVGIFSIVLTFICGFGALLGPVAWVMGNSAIREIDAQPGRYSNRGQIQAGRICGIVASALLILGILAFVALLAFGSSSS
ncbi:MAG: DUF4190 domain-containing protein [Actinobacteria bacterium]|nr:DUF4190 domain-containing protein [Actinomycetota bacterium]